MLLAAPGAHACLSSGDAEGATPLHVAAAAGDQASAQTLIDAGANRSAQDALNRSVLHLAVVQGSHAVAEQLLSTTSPTLVTQAEAAVGLTTNAAMLHLLRSTTNNTPTIAESTRRHRMPDAANSSTPCGPAHTASTAHNGGWLPTEGSAGALLEGSVLRRWMPTLTQLTIDNSTFKPPVTFCNVNRLPARVLADQPGLFMREYVLAGQPLIITNALNCTAPAWKRWQRNKLIQRYGSRRVQVRPARTHA